MKSFDYDYLDDTNYVHVVLSNKYLHIYWNLFTPGHHVTGIKWFANIKSFVVYFYYGEFVIHVK